MSFVKVCPTAQVPRGEVVAREVDGKPIALVHCEDGTYHALADVCSHQEFPLSDGVLAGYAIDCAWHGSEFDVRTGQPMSLPATEPVVTYPIEVRDGDLYVSLVPSNGVTK